jgi:SAM-dependent methyltransferase
MALPELSADLTVEDLLSEDGYSETFFSKIGLGAMESMDYSDYESATITHDLNEPVPEELHNQFDFIFDGGTIEHVFNVPVAVENVFNMLKTGGVFASANGLNGWRFHGIYQFNPEFVWSFWKRTCDCEVLTCSAVSENPRIAPIDLPDVSETGRRLRIADFPDGRVYLYYEVRKAEGSSVRRTALQSDYQARWSRAAAPMEA